MASKPRIISKKPTPSVKSTNAPNSEVGKPFSPVKQVVKFKIGAKPYRCGVCEERFSALVDLSLHMKSHPGLKPVYVISGVPNKTVQQVGGKTQVCKEGSGLVTKSPESGDVTEASDGTGKPGSCSVRDNDKTQNEVGKQAQSTNSMGMERRTSKDENLSTSDIGRDSIESSNLAESPCENVPTPGGGERSNPSPRKVGFEKDCTKSPKKSSGGVNTGQNKFSDSSKITGKMLYSCGKCHKMFKNFTDIVKHIRTHSGAKSQVNQVCNVHSKDDDGSEKVRAVKIMGPSRKKQTQSYALKTACERPTVSGGVKRSESTTGITSGNTVDGVVQESRPAAVHESPRRCCQQTFATKKDLIQHNLTTHTVEKPYRCGFCKERFSSLRELNRHMGLHKGEIDEIFEKEKKRIEENGGYEKIRKEAEAKREKELQEMLANAASVDNGQSEGRVDEVRRLMPPPKKPPAPKKRELYQCDSCGRCFKASSNLYRHLRICRTSTRVVPRDKVCKICTVKCDSPSALVLHMRTHTGEKPYRCDVCGRCFNTRNVLRTHMKVHTGEKPYACEVCGKRFSTRHRRNIHRQLHTGERPYSCDVCEKRFAQLTTLADHRTRMHKDVPSPTCEICQKRYTTKDGLKRHMMSHTGDRPHECKTCGKTYKTQGALRTHMKTHTGEKPETVSSNFATDPPNLLSCEICQKRFPRIMNLEYHMATHTRERPFKCDICNKKFILPGSLTSHMESHIQETTYEIVTETVVEEDGFNSAFSAELDPAQLNIQYAPSTSWSKPPGMSEKDSPSKQFAGFVETTQEGERQYGDTPYSDHDYVSLHCVEEVTESHKQPVILSNTILQQPVPIATNSVTVRAASSNEISEVQEAVASIDNVDIEPPSQPEQKSHLCQKCGKCFAKIEGLFKHMRAHAGGKRHTCTICRRTYATGINLMRHMRTHQEKRYRCNKCGQRFTTFTFLEEHMKTHDGENAELGDVVYNEETDSSDAEEMMDTWIPADVLEDTLEDNPLECEFCKTRFGRLSNLTRHKKICQKPGGKTRGVRSKVCDICNTSFTNPNSLVIHMRTHTGEKPFECDLCGKRFNTASSCKIHRRIHTGEKPFSCEICSKRFVTSSHRIAHMSVHTGEKPYPCDLCTKTFRKADQLAEHIRTHKNFEPRSCNICSKSYPTKDGLSRHMMSHTGERPHECQICGKTYKTQGALRTHTKTHTGEKPDESNVGTSASIELQKPFSCKICEKRFTRLINMEYHMGTHTREKPYTCQVCDKHFFLAEYLASHMELHTIPTR